MLSIGAINIYMLSALLWWAFALVRFQERNFESQLHQLDLENQLVNSQIENYLLKHTDKVSSGIQMKINNSIGICDSNEIKLLVNQRFKNFRVFFMTNK